jgi:hypothetical protein
MVLNLRRGPGEQPVAAEQLDRSTRDADEEADVPSDSRAHAFIRAMLELVAEMPDDVLQKAMSESPEFVDFAEGSERALRAIGVGERLDRAIEVERLRRGHR